MTVPLQSAPSESDGAAPFRAELRRGAHRSSPRPSLASRGETHAWPKQGSTVKCRDRCGARRNACGGIARHVGNARCRGLLRIGVRSDSCTTTHSGRPSPTRVGVPRPRAESVRILGRGRRVNEDNVDLNRNFRDFTWRSRQCDLRRYTRCCPPPGAAGENEAGLPPTLRPMANAYQQAATESQCTFADGCSSAEAGLGQPDAARSLACAANYRPSAGSTSTRDLAARSGEKITPGGTSPDLRGREWWVE
jgi:hypothetical protein